MGQDQTQQSKLSRAVSAAARLCLDALIRVFGYNSEQVGGIKLLLGVDDQEAKRLLNEFVRARPALALSYTVGPFAVFVGGLIVISKAGDLCENTSLDWLAVLHSLPVPYNILLLLLAHYTPPIVAATYLYRRQRKRVNHLIEQSFAIPLCIYCGYDCSAIDGSGRTVRCTECGKLTPVIRSS